jgi:hypothetical protein
MFTADLDAFCLGSYWLTLWREVIGWLRPLICHIRSASSSCFSSQLSVQMTQPNARISWKNPSSGMEENNRGKTHTGSLTFFCFWSLFQHQPKSAHVVEERDAVADFGWETLWFWWAPRRRALQTEVDPRRWASACELRPLVRLLISPRLLLQVGSAAIFLILPRSPNSLFVCSFEKLLWFFHGCSVAWVLVFNKSSMAHYSK